MDLRIECCHIASGCALHMDLIIEAHHVFSGCVYHYVFDIVLECVYFASGFAYE